MLDVLLDTVFDSLKLLPFLFITYLVLEFIEHKTEHGTEQLVQKSGILGPVVGSALGLVPQCGFSASASNLYAQRLISVGTLLAVFISTSDEMLPVLLSESADIMLIVKILAAKFLCALFIGLLIDLIYRLLRKGNRTAHLHDMCLRDNCHCEEKGILYSALSHTLQIAAFIFIVSFILNTIIHFIGEDALKSVVLNRPVLGSLISAAVGLIPNCAASVIITELFLSGAISSGALLSGLISSAGIGVLVLFRVNRENMKENFSILGILYLSGAVIGIIADIIGIVF